MKAVIKSIQSGAFTGAKNGAKVGAVVSALNIGALVVLIGLNNNNPYKGVHGNVQDQDSFFILSTIMTYAAATSNAILAPVVGVVACATAGSIVGLGKGLYHFFTSDETKNPKVAPATGLQKQ